ncbi:penicillin-binding transpeptidase domain-containing protein [Streptomyces sp. NBC_01217]|uniref:penicillin-binding transpeptidase domain-containing protein n=1 Tax=Streptomyces sp. NBC_01217 TaxID=2903779 RepID=UPI002E13D494|nr:penicillin-binding transpeptidase domain-containing protein [Streptomyces sp. NBC_01217]
MRLSARIAAFSLTVTALIGASGYGMALLIADEDVPEAAEEFFAAWADGDLDKASRLTTDPQSALIALKAYKNRTHVTSVDFTPEKVDGSHVPFVVKARISNESTTATWSYRSELDVSSDEGNGERIVWDPAIVHPKLSGRDSQTLETVVAAPATPVVGRDGTALDTQDESLLSGVIRQLSERYALKAGTASLQVRLAPLFGKGGRDSETVAHLVTGKPATIRTTIDPALQRAAEAAVAGDTRASAIAIRPSTGEVLAVASPITSDMNPALEGVEAPGSVFEIVTAAALLEQGAVTPTTRVDCPGQTSVSGTTFTNPKPAAAAGGGTFADVFATSCDTGFVDLADKLSPAALADEAKDVFGLGLNWQTGVTTADGAVPELTGVDKAAAAIGRGEVRLNVLNLASVTATVKNGTFKQPQFVDASMIGTDRAQTERSLSGPIAQQLRDMMRRNASHGTGAQTMTGISRTFSSMAGIAEQGTGRAAHAWFTAFSGDLAVAAVATDNGRGVASAGDITRAILDAR